MEHFSVENPTDPDAAIARLVLATRSATAPDDFLRALLAESVRGLSAKMGCLHDLTRRPGEPPCEVNPGDESTAASVADWLEVIGEELGPAIQEHPSGFVLTRDARDGSGEEVRILVQAIPRDRLLLILWLAGTYTPEELHRRQQFLRTLCDLREEFERTCELTRLREQSRMWEGFEEFSLLLQEVTDLPTLGSLVVNETRPLLGFDRWHLVVGDEQRCRVEAVTAADSVNRRSESVRHVVELCRAVVRAGDDLVYDGSDRGLPEEIRSPLQRCLRDSEPRYLAVVLLQVRDSARQSTEPSLLGALVVEQFDYDIPADAFSRLKALSNHVSVALARVLEWEVLPLKPVLRCWQTIAGRGRGDGFPIRRALAAFGVVLAVCCLLLIPVEFTVQARGELQPLHKRNVFAQLDGTIVETRSDFDRPVEAREQLLRLSRPDLDEDLERVRGELSKTRARLEAIASLRVNPLETSERDIRRLAAEESELSTLETSLQQQLEILRTQQDLLEVKSPLSGTVLTWNAEDLLTSRYVRAGQVLMTIADLDGPWSVDLRIPEGKIQFVQRAFSGGTGELPVEILLDARPDLTFGGTLRADGISRTTETDDDKQTFIPARIAISSSGEFPHRPGTSVRVKIECGRRALGFVWFHDLLEWVHRHLLF
jgi:multidrug efflux pump subunit AcrA (membrane-fusion protein)